MDRKIGKCKERAEKESAPKPPKPEDQQRLDDLQLRAKGEPRGQAVVATWW